MSRFTGKLDLQEIDGPDGQMVRTGDGRAQWMALSELIYDVGREGSGEEITFPKGATTDMGSIPQFAWSLGFSPDMAPRAFAIHDLLYRTCGTCMWNGRVCRTRPKAYTRAEADAILREALGVLGISAWRRQVIWCAVRLGGAAGWGAA